MKTQREAPGDRLPRRRQARVCLLATLTVLLYGSTASLASAAINLTLPLPLPVKLTLPLGLGTVQGTAAGGGIKVAATRAKPPRARQAAANPFGGRGVWIWVLSASNHGNLASIIATAHHYGVTTLLIKSGDGSGTWAQFNPQVVAALHAGGLRVCAWQYVYGTHPAAEAQVGAAAVKDRADCLVIDAESEYEGRYAQAQTYITTLRRLIGPSFPVALAGFPYVDYHPAFPYSVFLGPGGAQYNAPQMYWKDIGTSVNDVYAHTYTFNRLYGRPISPLGQIFSAPPARDVKRFRQLSRAYGAPGVSWWDWQEASAGGWRALSGPTGRLGRFAPDASLASAGKGAQGDLVVWAQEHLVSAGQTVTIDGAFGPKTLAAVERFQAAARLPATGIVNPATWQALLRYRPVPVRWTSTGAHALAAARDAATATASAARARRGSGAAGSAIALPIPKSASLPAKRDEIPGAAGRGWPAR
ncbi:MAG: hypothetical protein DLM64_10610 [Solirubrobacterales bacterium]|nr:MAG: hypothetical protein DLM64_10610 [Solirubrobacterales bacterium]